MALTLTPWDLGSNWESSRQTPAVPMGSLPMGTAGVCLDDSQQEPRSHGVSHGVRVVLYGDCCRHFDRELEKSSQELLLLLY